jgi:hypothetical protein
MGKDSIVKRAALSQDEREAVARTLGDPAALRGFVKLLRTVVADQERVFLDQNHVDPQSCVLEKARIQGARKLASEVEQFRVIIKEVDPD